MTAVRQAMHFHPAVAAVHRVNSGAHVVGTGKHRRFVRYHDVEGMSDLWIWLKPKYGPHQVFIEIKRPSEYKNVSEKQKEFLARAKAHGHISYVATSAKQAIELLDEGLKCLQQSI